MTDTIAKESEVHITPGQIENNRKAWVRALRSGVYRQGAGVLRMTGGADAEDKFCCLGVACDLVASSEWKVFGPGAQEETFYWIHEIDPFHMPDDIRAKFGITYEEAGHLAKLNDVGKLSFNEIADLIESHADLAKAVHEALRVNENDGWKPENWSGME